MNKENVPFTQIGKRQGNEDKEEKRSELNYIQSQKPKPENNSFSTNKFHKFKKEYE
jgi:hypothetical protein